MEEKIRFVDWNNPGVIYIGTSNHMHGLRILGGYPALTEIEDGYIDSHGEKWEERAAPEFWSEYQ